MGTLRFRVDEGEHPSTGSFVAILMASADRRVLAAVGYAQLLFPVAGVRVFKWDQWDALVTAVCDGYVRRIMVVRIRDDRAAVESNCLRWKLDDELRQRGCAVPDIEVWDPRWPLRLLHRLQLWWTRQFAAGALRPRRDDEFRLSDALPELELLMLRPPVAIEEDRLRVTLIDDFADAILGMQVLLAAWPGVDLSVLINDGPAMRRLLLPPKGAAVRPPAELYEADVVLLDEMMPGCDGFQIHRRWRGVLAECKRPPVIASTASRESPPWVRPSQIEYLHFWGKARVIQMRGDALRFIAFMNSLIATRKPHWVLPSAE